MKSINNNPNDINNLPVEKIGEYSFGGCTNLKEVYLPRNIKYLSKGLFCDCVGLEKIEPKLAYCLAAFCFSMRGGIYLAAVDDGVFTTFIILNSFDAVREDVGYGR